MGEALFNVANWQVHLPAPLLDTHDLGDRLAGLAAELAYTMAGLMVHDDPARPTGTRETIRRQAAAAQVREATFASALQPLLQDWG